MKKAFAYIYPLAVVIVAFAVYIFVGPISSHYACNVYYENLEYSYEKARAELIECIDEYIHTVAPTSALNGSTIFKLCDKYGVDIEFVLAQAQVESVFGTKGIAAKTNSVFNMRSYDGMSAEEIKAKGWGYSHPDKSVEPYLKLLNTRYLVGGKTEMDMLTSFTDKAGNRYASNPRYEKDLLNTMSSINKVVPIADKVYEYKKYKMLIDK